jgi:hypothetical protein
LLCPSSIAKAETTSVVTFAGSDTKDATVTPGADITTTYLIANNGSVAVKVVLIVRPVSLDGVFCGPDQICTLQWQHGADVLAPNSPISIALQAYGSTTIKLTGRAPRLGIYNGSAVLVVPGVKDPLSITVRLARKAANLGTNSVSGISGSRYIAGQIPKIIVTVRNNGSDVVAIGKPTATLYGDDGDEKYATAIGDVLRTCTVRGGSQGPLLFPTRWFDCVFTLDWQWAGRYRLRLDLPSAGLGDPRPTVDFHVRLHWLVALTILLISSALGAWLSNLQGSGRRRMVQAADALDLLATIRSFEARVDKSAVDTKAVAVKLHAEAEAIASQLENGSDADLSDKITALGQRLGHLQRFEGLEVMFREKGGAAGDADYDSAFVAIDNGQADTGDKLSKLQIKIRSMAVPMAGLRAQPRRQWRTRRLVSGNVLRNRVWVLDKLSLAFSIALVSALSLLALYDPNPDWGSAKDMLMAFVVGLGGTLSGSLTLTSVVSRVVMPTLSRPM